MSTQNVISGHSIISATGDQVSTELDGEAVILHLKSGIYYGLNSAGARVWNLIQEPITVSDIRDAILKEYEVEPDLCERDVLALLDELAAHGLVQVRDESDVLEREGP